MNLWLFLLLCTVPLLAQNGAIQATVVDSVTRAPIPGATVKLTPSGQSATAGPNGQFHFPALPPGIHRLAISHPGYMRDESQTVTIANAEVQLTAELVPRGQIAGRVTHPSGEPLKGVAVGLRRPWDEAFISTTITGEDGRFRLPDLEPGTWILAAIPAMRFSFRDASQNPKPIAEPGHDQEQRLGWATTFYPNAIAYADAGRIAVRPGVALDGYNIRLRALPVHRISGRVVDEAGNPAPKAFLSVGNPANKSGALITADAEGRFDFDAAHDGDWRLYAQLKVGEQTAKGYADVRVSREDRTGVEIRVALPFPLTGKVEREEPRDREGNRKRTAVYLIPQGATSNLQTETFHEQDGSFLLKSVYAGRYRVLPAGYVPGYYVASVWYGDQDVTTQAIEIANPPLPLRVVYKSGASRATGTVDRGEGRTVVLIPQDEALRDAHQHIRTAKCAANGRFLIESLRPGSYYALAFDRVRAEQLEDVEFVRTLTPRAARLEVRPGETATVDLSPQIWPDY